MAALTAEEAVIAVELRAAWMCRMGWEAGTVGVLTEVIGGDRIVAMFEATPPAYVTRRAIAEGFAVLVRTHIDEVSSSFLVERIGGRFVVTREFAPRAAPVAVLPPRDAPDRGKIRPGPEMVARMKAAREERRARPERIAA